MTWPSSRFKDAANGGSWTPADMNGVQDQYKRAAGISVDDLHETELLQKLGLTTSAAGHGGAVVRRGKSIIATEEARTNVAYGTLTTPDQVANVVLPTDGLIMVAYQALWKESVNGAARAAIFIGANQLKHYGEKKSSGVGPGVSEAGTGATGTANTYGVLQSCPVGLVSNKNDGTGGADTTVTTGTAIGLSGDIPFTGVDDRIIGGLCHIFAAAGVYTVSVQFNASSGSVTARERKLWVEARDY